MAGDDDLIGMCVIDISEAEITESDDPSVGKWPKWYKLNMGNSDVEDGEILLSFGLYERNSVPDYCIV